MIIIDPGHKYKLLQLDGLSSELLTFVKREGAKFPGNIGHYPGTNLQEVYRTAINRHLYLNNQEFHAANLRCIIRLRENIYDLEVRAAERHHRIPIINEIIETEPFCNKCGHIGCLGVC